GHHRDRAAGGRAALGRHHHGEHLRLARLGQPVAGGDPQPRLPSGAGLRAYHRHQLRAREPGDGPDVRLGGPEDPPRMSAATRVPVLSLLLGVGFVAPALLAPWLAPEDPYEVDLAGALEPPGPGHWLGRDEQGADILSRLIHGARISLAVGLCTIAVSA